MSERAETPNSEQSRGSRGSEEPRQGELATDSAGIAEAAGQSSGNLAMAGGSVPGPVGGTLGGVAGALGGVAGALGGVADGALGGAAERALGALPSGSPQQMATGALSSAMSLGAGALGSSLTSLGVPPEVVSAGMGLATSFAQQGLDTAVNLLTGLLGKQALPKVEYTLDVSDGPDVLWQVRRMHLTEALSEPYVLTLDLVTDDIDADTEAMLGASIELQIARDVLVRRVCGIIHQVEYIGVAHDRLQIRVKIGPALFLLGQRVDSRLWQNITVPDVIKEVLEAAFGDYSRTLKIDGLTASYEPREYIVQYHESDLDFVHRLMEEEGITYWFDHVLGKGKEVMVLEDSNDNYVDVETIDDDPGLRIITDRADNAEVESVQQFGWNRELTSTLVEQRIFNWQDPHKPILATGPEKGDDYADERGRVRRVYHHGHFVESDPQPRTLRKLMHLRQRDRIARGVGNVTGLFPGCKFSIVEHPRADLEQEYLVRRIVHTGDCPDVVLGEGAADGPRYQNHFEGVIFEPADPYRPPNVTPRPRIYGPQTAIVTGPQDEEIHTDDHGRVKVLFNWDRLSQSGDDTSMWIRVAHNWAGPGFGTFFLPRVGMEVVVEFIEGDPAKPLINGCVYNGVNESSVKPAEAKTQSVIRTRSSLDSEGYNEILFEDLKGSEKIAVHAQKDLSETVENSHSTTVKGGQSNSVGGNQSNTVSGKQTETVTGEATLTYENNRTVTVKGALDKLDASHKIEVTAPESIKLDCGGAVIEMTPSKIELSVGGSRVKLTKDLAELVCSKGACVWLTDMAKVKSAAGSYVDLKDDGRIFASGGAQVHLTGDAELVSLMGSSVKLSLNAEMTGLIEAKVGSTVKTTLGAGGAVEATPAGVSVSGSKVDLIAAGVATLAGAIVKIN